MAWSRPLLAAGAFLAITLAWMAWWAISANDIRNADPFFAIMMTAGLTPFFASVFMPGPIATLLYPIAVIAFAMGGGALMSLIPPVTDANGEPLMQCGLPAFAAMVIGSGGTLLGVLGRLFGLVARNKGAAPALIYVVQLAPALIVVLLCTLSSIR